MTGSRGSLTKWQALLSLTEASPRLPSEGRKEFRDLYLKVAETFAGHFNEHAVRFVDHKIERGITDEGYLIAIAVVVMKDWPVVRRELAREAAGLFTGMIITGFHEGASRQFHLIGGRGEWKLKNRPILDGLAFRGSEMARRSVEITLDGRLFGWAVKQRLRGKEVVGKEAPVEGLAETASRVTYMSGFNEGRWNMVAKSLVRGEVKKVWKHIDVTKTRRPDHAAINGVTVGLRELFPVAGGVKYPHDWERAGCDEWCNCACYVMYVPQRDAVLEPWGGD